MFHKVAFIPVLVFSLSYASAESKHAVSSQSYHRGDVPLSYKFTQVHDTPLPTRVSEKQYASSPEKKVHRPVQYAPIPVNAEDLLQQSNYRPYTKATVPSNYVKIESIVEAEKQGIDKGNIEPKVFQGGQSNVYLTKDNSRTRFGTYAPGHKIELLLPSYRHLPLLNKPVNAPAHAVLITNQEQEKVAHETESNGVNHKAVSETKTIAPITSQQFSKLNNFYSDLLHKRPFGEAHQALLYHDDHISQIVERRQRQPQHAAYALVPRRYMNVARAYGIAYNTNKAPINTLAKKSFNLEDSMKQQKANSNKKHYLIM